MHAVLKSAAAAAAALTLLAPAYGQAQPAPVPAQADYSGVEGDPALWAVTDEDTTMYLFGTFHLLPESLDWRSEAVEAALADSSVIVFEVDALSPEAQQQSQALLPQLGFNAPGSPLSSLLDEETNALLAEVAPAIGMTPQMLEPFQPWLASLTIALTQFAALGFEPNSGVEAVLNAEAETAGMEKAYLETIEQQLRFFADMPMELQTAYFAQGLRDIERTPAMVDEMVTSWATGDVDALYAILVAEMRDSAPEVYETLIVERNADWAPQLVEMMETREGGIFVAVGAGHMPGEYGVVALMRDAGYAVEAR